MKVVMLSYHSLPNGPELKPGDVHEFEDDEAARLISVKGARELTAEENEASAEAAAKAKADADAAAAAKAKAAVVGDKK